LAMKASRMACIGLSEMGASKEMPEIFLKQRPDLIQKERHHSGLLIRGGGRHHPRCRPSSFQLTT